MIIIIFIPTTTSTSTVAHMTTVLAIPTPTATAIPRNVEDDVYASIHNPRIVDNNNNILITKIEDRFMAQSFNDRFAKQHARSESDLLDNLAVHCYDILIRRLISEDNPQVDINQENVVQSTDDEPENLAQQPLFNLETKNQHNNNRAFFRPKISDFGVVQE